jgi:hypothetical protein
LLYYLLHYFIRSKNNFRPRDLYENKISFEKIKYLFPWTSMWISHWIPIFLELEVDLSKVNLIPYFIKPELNISVIDWNFCIHTASSDNRLIHVCPTWESFNHLETSPLPIKGLNLGLWDLYCAKPTVKWGLSFSSLTRRNALFCPSYDM